MNTKEELVENIKKWVSYDYEIKNHILLDINKY